eukprot:CAMPEP_0198128172 /NCGR_PEP_ID=MMETSP1442-20131203/48715_1 /TAXON_ID= /ORGANISM="Craspedostauros australis, Strain CCMP3328" /LENGTH=61 /DNA_ID=CAMNT_0043788279 /DNA_START=20 /DNA_END=205 /DNA_ORIENTATION=+
MKTRKRKRQTAQERPINITQHNADKNQRAQTNRGAQGANTQPTRNTPQEEEGDQQPLRATG